jgi:peroxiredoxin
MRIYNFQFINFYRKILLVAFFCFSSCNFSQENNDNYKVVNGDVEENINNGDVVYFTNGVIEKEYFGENVFSSIINDGKFKVKFNLPYPMMFKIRYKSEVNKIALREGYYFIDNTTDSIYISKYGNCSEITGSTAKEYKEKFIPHIFGKSYNCKEQDLSYYVFKNPNIFEEKLKSYIIKNPSSYVALWFLTEQFNNNGYKKNYPNMLSLFSSELKNQDLWSKLNKDLSSIRLKIGEKFPNLTLKNIDLVEENIDLNNNSITLVEYWFSSCKPCLERFDKLKPIYRENNSNGFNILAISTDRTSDINKWKNTVKVKEYDWYNFLDENSIEANKDKVTVFPTSFLLDKEGNIVAKDPSLQDILEILTKKE